MSDEIAELRAENERLRRILAALQRRSRRVRDGYREALHEALAALRAATHCECGREFGPGRCGICDNDE